MTPDPCYTCSKYGTIGCNRCKRWEVWWRERWAYIHAYAIAHGIQPTTPPAEEVNEIEDEEPAERDS